MPTTFNTAEPARPRRRWFQFRLRTLLVGVVLIGSAFGYIGGEARIVAERERLRGVYIEMEWYNGNDDETIPLVRRWMGDQSYGCISVRSSISDAALADFRRAFSGSQRRASKKTLGRE